MIYENQHNIAYLQSRNRNRKLWHSEQLLIILEILDNIADECIAWAIKNDSEKYWIQAILITCSNGNWQDICGAEQR